MSIGSVFLGLLEAQPRHGHHLERAYEERFATARPVAYGQVYATLSRPLTNGLVQVDGVERGGGRSSSAARSPRRAWPPSTAG